MSGHFTSIVEEILKGDFDDDLIIRHLIVDCQLINRLVEAWFTSAESEAQGQPRRGHMGHVHKMLQLVESLADYEENKVDEVNIMGDVVDRRSKHMLIRANLIKEHISAMGEADKNQWSSMKEELLKVNEVQSRSLGKRKLNCKIIFQKTLKIDIPNAS